MKFKSFIVTKLPTNEINLSWDYQSEILDTNDFIVRIGYANMITGPFDFLADVPFSTISYNYQLKAKGNQTHWFQIQLIELHESTVTDTLKDTIYEHPNLIVNKIRKKYNILLTKKVGNKGIFFKRKRVGHRCKECWDNTLQRVIKDACPTCFETSFGNDPVIDYMYLDGMLKLGNHGSLEFYKRFYTFNSYEYKDDEAIIKSGDEFRIYTLKNDLVLSTKINAVNTNYLILDYKDESILESLSNTKYSIFREIPDIFNGVKIQLKILKKNNEAWVYGLPKCDKFKYNDTLFTVTASDDKKLIVIGDITKLVDCEKFTLMYDNESIQEFFTPNIILYNGAIAFNETVDLKSKVYLDYYYDGINKTTVNGKIKILTEDIVPEKKLAYYSILDKTNKTHTLELKTLSCYDLYQDFDFIYDHMFSNDIELFVQKKTYCKALEQIEKHLEPNQTIQLPHTNIIKTGFDGCGVLLINLDTGLTYKGQKWLGDSFGDPGEIFVDPVKGEINTQNIPEGRYEIKYIYETKDILTKNIFLPNSGTYKDNELQSAEYWELQHDYLKNKNIDITKCILTTGFNKQYQTYEIEKYYPEVGKLLVKGPGVAWSTLTSRSYFTLELKHTGGFYNGYKHYMNYLSLTAKSETLALGGISTSNSASIIINTDVNLDPADVVYDPSSATFYFVLQVKPLLFKLEPTAQIVNMQEINFITVGNIARLLDR